MDEIRGDNGRSQKPLLTQGLFAVMKVIADTGFIVAFKNRSDQHHAWAIELAREITPPALTCESVLSETAFHLSSSAETLALVTAGMLEVSFDCNEHVERLSELALRYADRNPDLADLCLIRMSELHSDHTILTIDEEDFRVYRRNKREAIPLLCPPRK
jgi:predicted nucleic acid-binding protein